MNAGKLLWLLLVLSSLGSLARAAEEHSRIGTVLDTMDVGNYSYLKLDEQGEEIWLATLRLPVSPGDRVEYLGGDLMQDFYSKGLDRTFASIRFVTRIHVLGGENVAADPAAQADAHHVHADRERTAVTAPGRGDIAPVQGGRTIGELYAAAEELAGQPVSVRALVMKVVNNVMGKNWVTLQDGTGAAPEDKLMVTTLEAVTAGSQVTVSGIVRTDVDLGAGYRYRVLLENAEFAP